MAYICGFQSINYRYTEISNNLLIYGHSMTDGAMMGHIRTYLDPDICAAYPYFYNFTPNLLPHIAVKLYLHILQLRITHIGKRTSPLIRTL